MKYCWKAYNFNADADKVGAELETIGSIGELTKESIVEFAKNKKSELHKCFEWDDKIAGEKFRLHQANLVLVNLSIVVNEETQETTRMFVNIQSEEKKVFKNIVSVLENEEDYKQLLKKAEDAFISYKEKYRQMIEFQDLKNIIFKNI